MSSGQGLAADARQFQAAATKSPEVNIHDMKSCFVIDGLPRVPTEQIPSLLKAACNRIKSLGVVAKSFEMPTDPSGGGIYSCGYMFLECATKEDADKMLNKVHNSKLDASHTFIVNPWSDFNVKMVGSFAEPTEGKVFTESDLENPYDFLHDKTGREQFLIKSGTAYDVHISWHDPHMNVKQVPITVPAGSTTGEGAEVATAPSVWTALDKSRRRVQQDFPRWSPLGTFVAALEENRASLWELHSNAWRQAVSFDHPKLVNFEIGPTEKYAVTWCSAECHVWDISLCKVVKTFPLRGVEKSGPILRWNFDESFFVFQKQDSLTLYETTSSEPGKMKKTVLPNVEKDSKVVFSWAPESSVLFYSVEPTQIVEKPVRVYALHVGAGRVLTELSTRSLYSVTNIEMNWQSKGTKPDRIYCAISMRSTNSQRKDKIDLYRCGGKEIGIEQIEVSGSIISLEWDRSGLFGSRFCVCSTMKKNAKRNTNRFDFYHVQLGNLRLIKSIEDQQSNILFWSPKGTHAVAKNDAGTLEFYRIDTDNVTQLLLQEHYNCTHAAWDPSGRYFVTYIPIHDTEIDTGYRIYNFLGQLLHHAEVEKFSHIQWRPRPREFLAVKEQQEILKTLDTRIKEYEENEKQRRMLDQENAQRARDALIQNHKNVVNSIRQDHTVDTAERNKLRDKLPTLDGLAIFDEVPKIKETILDVKEIVY